MMRPVHHSTPARTYTLDALVEILEISNPHLPRWMDGSDGWAEAYAKAQDFVRQLTLLEKVNLTTGVGWEGEPW